jgi:hypothetical protein
MADYDYPAVMDEEDEKKKGYPMPIPSSATAPMPSAMTPPEVAGATPPTFPMQSSPAPTTMAREPESGLVRRGDAMAPAPINPQAQPPSPAAPAPMPATPPKPIGPQPTWNQYAPPEPSGMKRFGQGVATFIEPAMGKFFAQPEERAEAKYGAATKEYEQRVGEQERGKAAQSEAELKAAQAKAYGERGPTAIEVANIRGANQQAVADTNVGGRKDVATINADAKRDTTGGKAKYATLQTPDGKAIPGKIDAQGNLLDAEGNPAPKGTVEYHAPSYGETVGGRIISMIDPDTDLPTDYQVGAGGHLNRLGVSGTGIQAGREAQAGTVERAGENLIQTLTAHREKVGNVGAIIQSAFLGTPLADPELAGVATELGSFAALQPALHGFRGQRAMEEFQRLIGGVPKNVDALIASIKSIERIAGAVAPPVQQGGGNQGGGNAGGPPKAKPGMKVQSRTVNGKTEYRQVPVGR